MYCQKWFLIVLAVGCLSIGNALTGIYYIPKLQAAELQLKLYSDAFSKCDYLLHIPTEANQE